MNKRVIKNEDGFALLASIIIISTILLVIATVSARRVQDTFLSSVEIESHLRTQHLTEACINMALLNIAIDQNYAGNEVKAIGTESCTIRPIFGNVVEAEASIDNRWYRLRVTLESKDPVEIARWERVASF